MKKDILESFVVPELADRLRLSDFLPENSVQIQSRKAMKKAILRGRVFVNGTKGKTATYISGGERVEIAQWTTPKKVIIDMPIQVLFEDDHIAVLIKPAGISVSGNQKRNLENALPSNLSRSAQRDSLNFPQAIHRLDYPTSGVLLVGKTISSVKALNEQFLERKVTKKYYAVVLGKTKKSGTINLPVDDKESITHFKVLKTVHSERFDQLNLLDIEIETGRKHQIRKHLSHIGNPILGDKDYGIEGLILKGKGLYLHSYYISFNHPNTGQRQEFETELPKKFRKIFLTRGTGFD